MSYDIDHQPRFQQPIANRSLVTNDIVGAQSKRLHVPMDRHISNHVTHANQERLIPRRINNAEEFNYYGRRKYWYDMLHVPSQIIPQGQQHFLPGGRKHYEMDDGEIKLYKALENKHDVPIPFSNEFDRALQTNDIVGAKPGTLISKVVKNKEVAQKIKQQQIQQQSALLLSQTEDQTPEYHRYAQLPPQYTQYPDDKKAQMSPNQGLLPSQVFQNDRYKDFNEQTNLDYERYLDKPLNHNQQIDKDYAEHQGHYYSRDRNPQIQTSAPPRQYQTYYQNPPPQIYTSNYEIRPQPYDQQLSVNQQRNFSVDQKQIRFSDQGRKIMDPSKNYQINIIGNQIVEKPNDHRIRTQDYDRQRYMIGLQRVPAAQPRLRPF